MQLVLNVNILPIFKGRGQELKAHLSIESTNGSATRISLLVNNLKCLSRFPLGSASLGVATSPHCHCVLSVSCFTF